ncbi:MAG: efflux RND transporter periplasmic adaptor subunit [Gammaproteobacteria bacterium]
MNKLGWMLAGCALVAQGTLMGCSRGADPTVVVPEVVVTPVVERDVPLYLELVGQTRGSQDVQIRARVEGFLTAVQFTEGAFVPKGTPLYRIDPRPLEAALLQARANLASQEAQLRQAEITARRLAPLAEQQAVSRQELENAESTAAAARAQREAAQAAVDKATLDLSYTFIDAPIDGVVGTSLVMSGNLVGRGESTLLTTVSQVDPILFRAGLGETEYLRLARQLTAAGAGDGGPAATDETAVAAELLLADGTVYAETGRVAGIERAIDATTGTLMVQFAFPNPQRLLCPGQFGRVRVRSELRRGALLVPQRAVQALQDQHTVAVVDESGTVSIRSIRVGPRVESLWIVESGLKLGEQVVSDGLQRLKNGMTVRTTAAGRG